MCFLHSYANPDHELRMRDVLRREHPDAVVSISSDVLREYREYERSMTTLVDAAVKPTMARYVRQHLAASCDDLRRRDVPFYVMKSNGGVLSADEVVHQPITTVLSGPAAGALGAALVAREAGFDQVLTCDGGGTSTDVSRGARRRADADHRGHASAQYPSKIPMIDVVTVGAGGGSVAWVSPGGRAQGRPALGRAPTPARSATAGAAPSRPSPTRTWCSGASRRTCSAARCRWTSEPRAPGRASQLDSGSGSTWTVRHGGILEISAWNQANALRQVTVQRGLDVRDFTMTTFGGSGSLLLCRLVDIARARPVGAGAGEPGQRVGVRPAHRRRAQRLRADRTSPATTTSTSPRSAKICDDLTGSAGAALDREGFARADHGYQRSADLRYFGQAFEVRVPAARTGTSTRPSPTTVADAFHDAHEQLYGYCVPRTTPGNRSSGSTCACPGSARSPGPSLRRRPPGDGDASRARTSVRRVFFDAAGGWVDTPVYWRPDLAPVDALHGPAVIEEFGVDRAAASRLRRHSRRARQHPGRREASR